MPFRTDVPPAPAPAVAACATFGRDLTATMQLLARATDRQFPHPLIKSLLARDEAEILAMERVDAPRAKKAKRRKAA